MTTMILRNVLSMVFKAILPITAMSSAKDFVAAASKIKIAIKTAVRHAARAARLI